ncbi:hypothetical protein ACFU93_25475 [Streptomyces sp. NPDC057611]
MESTDTSHMRCPAASALTQRNERIEQHSIDYVPVTERHGRR